jgi:DNA-binding NarL/FixJ family response regulator
MIRILIVDDHAMVRSGLATLLSVHDDLVVVGTAASGEEALSLCNRVQADIALVDLMLPSMSGIETIQALRKMAPSLRCMALTSFGDPMLVAAVLKAGAVSFLHKDISGNELADTIRCVYAGQMVLAARAELTMVDFVSKDVVNNDTELSEREFRVLEMISTGLTNGEIAYRLHLKPSTIKTYVKRIFVKLKVNSRAEAASVAARSDLLMRS